MIDLHSLNNHGSGALRIICADASVFSTDNICKLFGHIKLFGSKLFDTLMIFLKQFDQVVFKKIYCNFFHIRKTDSTHGSHVFQPIKMLTILVDGHSMTISVELFSIDQVDFDKKIFKVIPIFT